MNKDLGRRIKFNKIIKKHRNNSGCEWIEEDTEMQQGVIVGKRTVLTGEFRQSDRQYGFNRFIPTIRHSVYLVSRNMNSKFIHVPINAIEFSNNQNNSWWS